MLSSGRELLFNVNCSRGESSVSVLEAPDYEETTTTLVNTSNSDSTIHSAFSAISRKSPVIPRCYDLVENGNFHGVVIIFQNGK